MFKCLQPVVARYLISDIYRKPNKQTQGLSDEGTGNATSTHNYSALFPVKCLSPELPWD